ncbi:MAG: hypothetical protein H7122_15480 [Chitinophagaceae bacterium]|nr:hypothetical protein [Chitinophagaceae bacterium]
MLNYKALLAVIITVFFLTGCNAPKYLFNRNSIVPDTMIENISKLLCGRIKDPIRSTRLFEAVIQEKLVESDAVAEYKLMDSLSEQTSVDLEVDRYSNRLYFYEMASVNKQDYGIFLAATFQADGSCIGIGPLYIGHIGKGDSGSKKFTTEFEYRIKKEDAKKSPVLVRKSKAPELILVYSYVTDKQGQVIQMNIFQVIQKSKNKVSGINKPLVYNISKIFNDPKALTFSIIKKD